jgi:hypothetical protein
MTLTEILKELPKLTILERQELMAAMIHLDPPLVSEDERVILEARLKYAEENSGREIPFEELEARLVERYRQRSNSDMEPHYDFSGGVRGKFAPDPGSPKQPG